MKLVVMLGVFAVLGLAVLAAEGPARSASPVPDKAGALAEAPAERREVLRERRLTVVLTLKDTTSAQGVMESYEPGKDGLPGTFVLGLEGGKTKVVYEVDVVRVEVGEAVKEARPPKRELPPELQDAIKTGMVEQLIKKRQASLKKASGLFLAERDLRLLAGSYRYQGLDKKIMRERLQADVDSVENEPIRIELHKLLQDERFMGGRPLRPGAGRGPGSGN